METHILLRTNNEFFLIVHAAPNRVGRFQWYWMKDPNEGLEHHIKGQIYESITLSSENIRKHHMGKWLACRCEMEGTQYNEGCLYLTDDFLEMIKANQFDAIGFFDDDGNIRSDVCYGRQKGAANHPS